MHSVYLLLLLVPRAHSQVAVADPISHGILAMQKAQNDMFQSTMKLQFIQDAAIIKDNLLEARAYYAYVDHASKHRGGLVGFYQEQVTNQFHTMIDQDKMSLMNDATTVTGANAVDDFMGAVTEGAETSVRNAGTAANDTLGSGVSSFNAGYNNVTNYQVADTNLAVRTWQQNRNAISQAEFARTVTVSRSVGVAMTSSTAMMGMLIKSLTQLETEAAKGDLTNQEYEANNTAMNSLRARIGIEQYKMMHLQAVLSKTLLDEQNTQKALLEQVQTDLSNYSTRQGQQKTKFSAKDTDITTELKRVP